MAIKKLDGVLDKVVVGYLGSILSKIPIGKKTAVGCLMTAVAFGTSGVFSLTSFDHTWSKDTLDIVQLALDVLKYSGETLMVAGAAHKLVKATPGTMTASGKPEP